MGYTVPGLIVSVSAALPKAAGPQRSHGSTRFSIAIETAVGRLGPTYLRCFRDNAGLPIKANRQLAEDAGLVAKPLMNLSLKGWRGCTTDCCG